MRAYLLTFNEFIAPRQTVVDFLDTRREVLNWYAFGPAGIIIISRKTAHELAAILHEQYPGLFFLLTEVDPAKTNGFLPKQAWDFMNMPRSSGRWE